uniref:Uncharacterized protein n=1 Tax=Haptolina ericina TaxID=156174 RepID=A0A7S3ASJ6_9EUKA
MDIEASNETVAMLKALRSEDQEKLLRAVNDRASLAQQVKGFEERLASATEAAERQASEFHRQRYESQAALTEAHRRCEDLQAAATRAEMTLQHERQSGAQVADGESKAGAQLDKERLEKLKLSQELAGERTLRRQSEASVASLEREVQVRTRDAELATQRLQNAQFELSQARGDARQARELLEATRAEMQRLEREHKREIEQQQQQQKLGVGHARPSATVAAKPSLGTPPSLQRNLQKPSFQVHPPPAVTPPPPSVAPSLGNGRSHVDGRLQSPAFDELSRSDVWNFSSGAAAGRGGRCGAGPLGLPRIKSPYNTAAADAGLSRDMSRDAALDESESRALYAITYIDGDK